MSVISRPAMLSSTNIVIVGHYVSYIDHIVRSVLIKSVKPTLVESISGHRTFSAISWNAT